MSEIKLDKLNTEQQNPNTWDIDTCSTEEVVTKINNEDQKLADVVKQQIPSIAKLIDACVESINKGGRVIYVGAGTSGRLGILDASECPPTYGVSAQLVQGVIAGGNEAIFTAKEGAEDSKEGAVNDLKERNLNANDIVIGLAASGRTPYVMGALEYANRIGCLTGSVACVDNAQISSVAKFPVEVVSGPEVITGSTRMKAGTVTKMVLNMISTASMIKIGKVFHNYMVDVQPTNLKLEVRATNIIKTLVECDENKAHELFIHSGKNVKCAIVMGLCDCDLQMAKHKLENANGILAKAII